jgi:hypothetical protein
MLRGEDEVTGALLAAVGLAVGLIEGLAGVVAAVVVVAWVENSPPLVAAFLE